MHHASGETKSYFSKAEGVIRYLIWKGVSEFVLGNIDPKLLHRQDFVRFSIRIIPPSSNTSRNIKFTPDIFEISYEDGHYLLSASYTQNGVKVRCIVWSSSVVGVNFENNLSEVALALCTTLNVDYGVLANQWASYRVGVYIDSENGILETPVLNGHEEIDTSLQAYSR